jgi:hypothetical protein
MSRVRDYQLGWQHSVGSGVMPVNRAGVGILQEFTSITLC